MSAAGGHRHVNVAGERRPASDLSKSDLLRLRFGVTKGEREAWASCSDGELRSARDTAAGDLGTGAGFLEAKAHSDDIESIVEQYEAVSDAIRRLAAIEAELQTRRR